MISISNIMMYANTINIINKSMQIHNMVNNEYNQACNKIPLCTATINYMSGYISNNEDHLQCKKLNPTII